MSRPRIFHSRLKVFGHLNEGGSFSYLACSVLYAEVRHNSSRSKLLRNSSSLLERITNALTKNSRANPNSFQLTDARSTPKSSSCSPSTSHCHRRTITPSTHFNHCRPLTIPNPNNSRRRSRRCRTSQVNSRIKKQNIPARPPTCAV